MSWLASFLVLVIVNPGRAKGGSLMVVFLTMASDIHRPSVAVLPHDPMVLHNVRKFQFYGVWEQDFRLYNSSSGIIDTLVISEAVYQI
jgi:hypothetical protein